MNILHKNIEIEGDKHHSAQGSVFYASFIDKPENKGKGNLVLKIYSEADKKSYIKEINVLKKIEEYKKDNLHKYNGFPTLISCIEGPNSAEILMETIGPNLRKQLKDTPGGVFSRSTVYQITIQMVSSVHNFVIVLFRFTA